MITKKCICGVNFQVSEVRLRYGRGKFCSKKCQYKNAHRPSGLKYKIVMVNKGWLKKGHKLGLGRKLSKEHIENLVNSHKGKHFSPKTEFKYKNGMGYRHLLLKGILKQECVSCGENKLKRLHVHHKDKNRKNNKISNLTILCRPCHLLRHNRKERQYVEGRKSITL